MAYGQKTVLADVTTELTEGELVCMVGANGSGKSTLLRAIAGLQRPHEGTIQIKGRPLYGRNALPASDRARCIAVVLTEPVRTGYLTVRQLVQLGRMPYEPFRGQDAHGRAAVERAFTQTGTEDLAPVTVSTLSDGQKQRVMIARALAQEPKLLLLDEPASYLDPPHQVDLFARLKRLTREDDSVSILVATHSIELALHFADRMWLCSNRGMTVGLPDEVADPRIMEAAFPHPDTRFDPQMRRFVPNND